ncbi:MAG: HlyC/CorC family transporter [Gemmatimonadaceae bacterium]|nr:HlyC/CorC family transporter [Gemmatimonadaceae bacterium]MCW5825581.1 HlyC/CorC family transporter [Gemmatimonadaceae bacterium]
MADAAFNFTPALIVAVLVLANGLFVAAEFAIVGAPRATIDRLANAGNRAARLVRRIVSSTQEVDRFIATAQLGITLASLGLGMYGEHLLAVWLAERFEALGAGRWVAAHTLGSVFAIAFLTYIHIVIGEMVPKSIALAKADRAVLWIAPVMRLVQFALYPFVVVLNGIGNAALRAFGVRRQEASAESVRTPDELAYIVRESSAGGLLKKQSASVVQELLEFGDLTAAQVMVPRVSVVGLDVADDAVAVHAVLARTPHSRYPVMDGDLDNITGMLHVKDLLAGLADGARVAALPVRPVPFVPETASADQVLAAMRQQRSQLVVVMDEHGGTAGIITLEDLIEEIVGELTENATAPAELRARGDGSFVVAGTVRVVDAGVALGAAVEHPDVESVSGLVLALLGRPPKVGDVVEFEELRIEVQALRGRGVREALVSRRAPR